MKIKYFILVLIIILSLSNVAFGKTIIILKSGSSIEVESLESLKYENDRWIYIKDGSEISIPFSSVEEIYVLDKGRIYPPSHRETTKSQDTTIISNAEESRFSARDILTAKKRADIKRFMEISGSLKISQQMSNFIVAEMTQTIKKAHPDVPAEIIDIVRVEVNSVFTEALYDRNGLLELITQIYHKYYTHSDIKALISFYQTDLGKKVIKVTPALTQESMTAGQRWGEALTPVIRQRIMQRLQERVK